jgi:hypothetical protein
VVHQDPRIRRPERRFVESVNRHVIRDRDRLAGQSQAGGVEGLRHEHLLSQT